MKFVIATARQRRPVAGLDSMIGVPPDWLQACHSRGILPAGPVSKLLRTMSEQAAAGLGETLHHADWVITADLGKIEAIGMAHDCLRCRAATDQALAHLSANPGKPLLAGVLYWAG